MAKSIFAVRIYLDLTSVDKTEIGLYSIGAGASALRWIESDISAYNPTYAWKTGILVPDWLEPITDSYDGTIGGSVGEVGMGGIKIVSTVNYESNQRNISKVFSDLGVRLNGRRCDIIEFEIANGALIAADGTVVFRCECGSPEYDEMFTRIEVQTALLNRRSNLGTQINEVDFPEASSSVLGKAVPMTFGEYISELDSKTGLIGGGLARMDRTANKETKWTNANFDYLQRYPNTTMFPITGLLTLGYDFHIRGNNDNFIDGTYDHLYVRVVDGKGSGNSPRLVTRIEKDPVRADGMTFYIDTYFTEDLSQSDNDEEGRSWVEFVVVNRDYDSDLWPCKNFLDDLGTAVTLPIIYGHDSDASKFERLAAYGYKIDIATTNKNKLIIDPMHFLGSEVDSCSGFFILPVDSVFLTTLNDLNSWELETSEKVYKRVMDGIHSRRGAAHVTWFDSTDQIIQGTAASATDKDSTTYFQFLVEGRGSDHEGKEIDYYKTFTFILPKISDDYNFDKCYLGIKLVGDVDVSRRTAASYYSRVKLRRWAYKTFDILTGKALYEIKGSGGVMDDLPDYYYADLPSTGSKNFYRESAEISTGIYNPMTGYTFFDLNIDSIEKYNSIIEGILAFRRRITYTDNGSIYMLDNTKLYELAIIFGKELDIKSNIFTGYQGRIFNSTFDSRQLTDLIDTPKLALMHTLMLQNWNETGELKNWGKEYPTTPLIDISTNEGGFHYYELQHIDNIKLRRQIFDYDEMWSDKIVDSLCRDFFIVPSQDHATGNERISFIGRKHQTASSVSITLDQIVGKVLTVKAQPEKAIFCEPFVRYNYNSATEKYDGLLQIKYSGATGFLSNFVIGITGSAAENAWNKAHKLWEITQKVEMPPEELTDKKWIYRHEDALWYLDTWLYYMGAVDTELGIEYASRERLGFNVHYTTGKALFKGQHINLTLPFHTESVAIECVIESVSKGRELVGVDVMLLDNITEDDFYIIKSLTSTDEIQKVIPEFGTDDDWNKVL
ncbi:hypothetical protein [Sulfuricurvum sp.]|uniref:hypothetical protein n=1 Tax=Sulfuricurvum sp. TaxID=2025608 RepID=UPI00356457CD